MTTPLPTTTETRSRLQLAPRDRVAMLGFVFGAAAIAMLVGLQAGQGFTIERPWVVLVVAIAFAASEGLVFHIEARNEAVAYTPHDIWLAVGIILLNPLGLLVARFCGGLLGMVFVRRPALFKLAYNASLLTFETALALVVFRFLSSHTGTTIGGTWLALIGSLSVSLAAGGILVAAAISQFEGGLATRIRREARRSPVLYLPGVLFAASVAVPASVDLRLGLVALVPIPLLWAALRMHGALLGRFTDLTSVHLFTQSIGSASDLGPITDIATKGLSEHLRADHVAVRLWLGNGRTLDSAVDVDLSALPLTANDPQWETIISGRVVTRIDELDDDLHNELERAGFTKGLIAPLIDDEGPIGIVVVGQRNGAFDVFDDDDVNRFFTMAQQLCVVIRKGHLHEQITFEATHDRLTSLPNRAYFEQEINAVADDDFGAAVLLIDLDRFKQINDTFGHHAGDVLLIEAARRIRAACTDGDLVARFGGDEFAVFAPGLSSYEAQLLADEISAELERTFDIGPANVAIGASVGIALMPHHGTDAIDILRCADLAMYDAKNLRVRSRTFRKELSVDTADRLTMLSDLRTALRNRELTVHFQPQLDLATGMVCGAEALARWEHPEIGRIPPDVFIELAEQAGLIDQLTAQVLELATTAAARWHADGKALTVSVNISAQSILDERLDSIVAQALQTSGMDPSYLMLEITESTMMADDRQTPAILRQLAELGIRVSVDDFGTGFSSLVNLRKLEVNEIKIDRSFVSQMMLEHDDEVIVRSIVDLGHNLGLSVVAEGVETLVTLSRLTELGCDIAQGYGISRPLPMDQFDRWLQDRVSVAVDATNEDSEVTIASFE